VNEVAQMNQADIRNSLIRVRTLLADPSHWTRGYYAKDKDQYDVSPYSSTATCWCLEGAFLKVVGPSVWARTESDNSAYTIISNLCREKIPSDTNTNRNPVAYFNDAAERTHAEVLELLDLAIEKAS
jgi:hypothetical protein